MIWTCMICGRVESSDEPPEGWATGHDVVCSADCLRAFMTGLAVAVLFPHDATEAEHKALRDHEDALIARLLAHSSNPTMIGKVCGSLFLQREEREAKR